PGAGEAGLAGDQLEVLGRAESALVAAAEALDDVALALADAGHVDLDPAGVDAVVGGAAGEVGDAAAGDHRLGRGAALVDAGAADVLALDQRGRPAGGGEGARERHAAL